MSAWYKDLEWTRRGVTVRETGAAIAFDGALLRDLLAWLPYFICEAARALPRKFFASPAFTASFAPKPARQWYLIRMVLLRAGVKIAPENTSENKTSDLSIFFHDKTNISAPSKPPAKIHFNFDCEDISKTRVAAVFKDVFGYSLAVDPLSHSGPMVCKSEENGAHDGSIILGPCPPKPNWVYQHVIDNQTKHGTVQDLRCPTIRGAIPLVYIKERPTTKRFANMNAACQLSSPEVHFSEEELALISRFCVAMGLDWGGLDILRDNMSKKIYIVDVNKTDMGPPLALPLKDKLASTTLLAKALTKTIKGTDA